MISINNRRYLGSKYKLLDFIKSVVCQECPDINSFFDVFAGTGVVASAFLEKKVIVNDLLYSNHLAHKTWFSSEKIDKKKLLRLIKKYNSIKHVNEENYMSENFSDTYFSHEVCKKIGFIREDIENLKTKGKINDREHSSLITSLLYAVDKIAKTCGHYDAYRRNVVFDDDFIMEMPEYFKEMRDDNECFNADSNELADKVECDLAYLDPPYNSRQYCDAYHLLENIARWEKKQVFGVAKKMDRSHLKSDYCTGNAKEAFSSLIDKLKCKYILLSYNNTGNKSDGRSNAKITDEDIVKILSAKGEVKIFSQKYRAFTTGKSHNDKNEERLFLCVVKENTVSSPLNYTGGKGKLIPQLKELFPSDIDTFVDLFCGGLNVGINVRAENYIYNDVSKPLIQLHEYFFNRETELIIEDVESIVKKYGLTDSSRKGYAHYACDSSNGLAAANKSAYDLLKQDFNKCSPSDEKYPSLFFCLIIFSFNNQIRFNKKNEFNLPVGKRDFNDKIKTKTREFANRLKRQCPTFLSKSFVSFDIQGLTQKSLVYCDPPYLITNASYNENDGWTETDERELLDFLDKLNSKKIRFALSNVLVHDGKKNSILNAWLEKKKYVIHYLKKDYSNSSYHRKNKKVISEEVLITNY